MSEDPKCPKCKSEFTYPSDSLIVCSECFHEWNPEDVEPGEAGLKVLDANGNELHNGDSVIVIKDLPVKGALRPIKVGTKVKIFASLTATIILTVKLTVLAQWA